MSFVNAYDAMGKQSFTHVRKTCGEDAPHCQRRTFVAWRAVLGMRRSSRKRAWNQHAS